MKNPEVILLTDTLVFGEVGNMRYMGTYALAGQLEQAGFRVLVIDYFTQHSNFFYLLSNFLSEDLLFIGISSTFLTPLKTVYSKNSNRSDGIDQYYDSELWFKEGKDLASWLSELKSIALKFAPFSKIVLGGAKSQFAIWRKDHYKNVDYVCLGAADKTIVALAGSLKKKLEPHYYIFEDTRILDNQKDIDEKFCPTTVWHNKFSVQKQESLPIEIARGCVFNCKFCHYNKMESFKKNLNALHSELVSNYERFGTTTYHFCDDCFNDHPKKVESVCEVIQRLNFKIEWVAYARVDVAVKFPDTMDAMIQSGAKGLYFGIESFKQEAALKAGKGTPIQKVKEFLIGFKNKYSSQCLLEGSFIAGLPGETKDSMLETKKWLLENPVFDFVTIGPLGIMPYVSHFDKKLFDYADYSRSPEKYGFKSIDFKARYWEHETFNSIEAAQSATDITLEWRKLRGFQKLRSIWLYPHYKTLGYSSEEIFKMARVESYASQLDTKEIIFRFEKFKSDYWINLVKNN